MAAVSVLMSVYNTPPDYLHEAIESILKQSFQDFEFVIVDDGSDNRETINELETEADSNSKIVLIRNLFNRGLTEALNIGIKYCKGKYIARMDSDDISLYNRLEVQYKYMEKHKDVCVLGSNVCQLKTENIYLPKFVNYTKHEELFKLKMIFNNVGPVHSSAMIRKDFLEKKGILYRTDIKKAQDYALWLDCINSGGIIKCLDECLIKYRLHSGQITNKNEGEQLKYKRQIIMEQIKINFGNSSEITRKVLSTLFTCHFEYKPSEYIREIRFLIRENGRIHKFDQKLFEREMRARWIHKIMKCSIKGHEFDGWLCPFSFRSLFSLGSIQWIRNTVFFKG